MAKQSPAEVDVVISVDNSHISQLSEMAKQLSSKGLKDVQELKEIGIISGKCDPKTLKKLQGIAGVSAIELSGNMQIAPPESDIQ